VGEGEELRVLLNAHAGAARDAEGDRLAGALKEAGIRARIEAVEPHELARGLARLAGERLLGVAGGDGTHRTAARALAGSNTALVPIPTGTLNHFARRLGIDSVEAAAGAVRAGRVRVLPVGRANDSVFLNTAVIGSYPRLVQLRDRLSPALTKWPAAALAAAVLWVRWPRVRLLVRTPHLEMRIRTPLFWVGVGRGSFPFVHESPVPDRAETLEAVVLPGTGRRGAVRLLTTVLRHRLGRPRALERSLHVMRAPWIELHSDRSIPIALDGEPRRMVPPLRLRLEPEALRVVTASDDGG
jgi:diacylglycerol kinase family enzyme